MMRKWILSLAIAASLMLTGSALAQDQQPSQPAQQGETGGHAHKGMRGQHQMDPQAQLDHMSKQLNLTDDQKAKIQPILEDTSKQMQALQGDTSLSRQDRMAKVRELHQNAMSQIEPVLTADQRAKFEKMQQQHMRGGRRGKRGGAAQSQPSQQ